MNRKIISLKRITLIIIFITIYTSSNASFSLSGSVITQNGTDNNLDGLSSISGVETITIGSGANVRKVYYVGNRRILINGTLTLNPEREMIKFGTSAPRPTVEVRSGATFNMGVNITQNGHTRQSEGVALYFAQRYSGCCSINNACIGVRNGGILNWRGATIDIAQELHFENGSTIRITNGKLIADRGATSDVVQVRQHTPNIEVNGLTFIGDGSADWTFIQQPRVFSGYNPIHVGGALGFSGHTPNVDIELRNYEGYGNFKDVKLWQGCRAVIINPVNGSEMSAGNHKTSGSSSGFGIIRVYKEIEIQTRNTDGSPAPNAVICFDDYDSGNRELYNRESPSIDLRDDISYSAATNSSGNSTVIRVLLAANVANNGSANNPNTGVYAWDYRSKYNDTQDKFDIHIWSYLHNYEMLYDVELKGADTLSLTSTLYNDEFISEVNQATVASYSGINVNYGSETITINANYNLDQLYDYLKYNKTQNCKLPTLSTTMFSAGGNNTLLCNYNIVVNSELSAGTNFNKIISTQLITKGVSGKIKVPYTDSNYDSYLSILGAESTDNIKITDSGGAEIYNLTGESGFPYQYVLGEEYNITLTSSANEVIYRKYPLHKGINNKIGC